MSVPQLIEYRLLWFEKQHGHKETPKSWAWAVYAGQDGSTIAYKPEQPSCPWCQLRQTWDEGYWLVNIELLRGRKTPQRVHRMVAFAFAGLPNISDTLVMHLDSERDNNEAANLRWGDDVKNRAQEEEPENKQRREYWNEWIQELDLNNCPNDLPMINDFPGGRDSTNMSIVAKRNIYRWKWWKRGVRKSVKDVMPEKLFMENTADCLTRFNDASLEFESITVQVPSWDCRLIDEIHGLERQGEEEAALELIDFHDAHLPRRFFFPRHWTPFRRRFRDDMYQTLRQSRISW